MRIPSAKTDQLIFFVAVDATDLKTRLTGLSSFTVYRSRNGGAATAYTTPTVAQLDSTNMPGVYSLAIDEDTTIASTSDSEEYCVHITQATMAPVTRVIELYRRDTTTGRTLDVSSGGEAGVDWANVGSATTTVDLSNTTIKTTQKVDVDTIKTNPVVNGGTITFPTTATLASTTNITAGTITTATNLTNLPTIPADWLTAAGTNADFGTEIAAAVWKDAVAGDFTVASSIGKSLYTGNVAPGGTNGLFIAGTNAATTITTGLTTHLIGTVDTLTTYTGNTPQTGDCYPKVDTEVATLVTGVADIQSRLPAALTTGGNMKSGVQGFLDSVFTEGAAGRITAAFKQFFNIGTPAATMDHGILVDTVATVGVVTGAVGSVAGNVDGNVTGDVIGDIGGMSTGALDDFFKKDSGDLYSAAIAGSVVKEIADNASATILGTIDGKIDTIDGIVDDILLDTAEIGTAGAGLTNINLPNQTMDIVGNITGNLSGSVGSVSGAVGSVAGNVGGNVVGSVASVSGNVGGNVTGTIGGMTVAALADFFDTDTTKIFGDAVAGSVVKELADNVTVVDGIPSINSIVNGVWDEDITLHTGVDSTGEALAAAAAGSSSPATIAAAVWDEAIATHLTPGSTGEALDNAGAAGTPPTVNEIVDGVWDAAITDHLDAGSTGEALSIAEAAGTPPSVGDIVTGVWDEALAGHAIGGSTGEALTNAATIPAAPPSVPDIVDGVWDAVMTDHLDSGSTGENLSNAAATATPPPSAAEVADAVWDETMSEHVVALTTGFALNGAASAGDPWGTTLPGAYGANTAGALLSDIDVLANGADGFAAIKADTAAILVDTGTTLDDKLDVIDGKVDAIFAAGPSTPTTGTGSGITINLPPTLNPDYPDRYK